MRRQIKGEKEKLLGDTENIQGRVWTHEKKKENKFCKFLKAYWNFIGFLIFYAVILRIISNNHRVYKFFLLLTVISYYSRNTLW